MEIINVHSSYSAFKKNINKKPCQIIGTMKSLALSNNNYSNFYNSTTNLFTRKTFKLPNETSYPILRESHSKYISLKNKLNTFSFHEKSNKSTSKKASSFSPQLKLKKVFSEVRKNKMIKKKKINFFICENNYGGNNNNYMSNKDNQNKYFRNKKNYHYPPDFYKNFNTFKNISPLEEIKNPEERIKQFFMFLNTVFIKDNYHNLKYDENEIFGHKDDYLEYIKDEFNYFLQKEKEINMKSNLYHFFKTKDYGKVELFLKSARIDIIDESHKNNNIKISINIPFNLMSLIYIINIEQINEIIFFLLNKINIEKNSIPSENDMKKLYMEILSDIKNENNNIIIDFKKKDYEKYYAQIFFLEKIQAVSETIRYNYFFSDFNKNPNVINITDNSYHGIYNSSNYKNKRILFHNNINYYKLLLIAQNNIRYKIKFSMPEISILFNNYEKQLNHCINKELFIYLYQNNFMDWNFYIFHYLFYQKNFRLFIGKVLSLNNNYNLFLSKKIINLENNKIEFSPRLNSDKPKEQEKKKSDSINNSYKKYYLSNNYFSNIDINENDSEFIFTSIDEDNINICKLKSYTLYSFINNINKPKIYEFNFNFKQMRILYFKSLFQNFDLFLKRLIFIKNDTIYFDYAYFDTFYSMSNKELYELFSKSDENNKGKEVIGETPKINSLILRIREPHIEIICKDKNNKNNFQISQFHVDLDKDFIHNLMNTEYNKWIEIIEKNNYLFDIKKFIKYEDSKVKKIKRKSLIKGKKKDFQSAFMQFLKLTSSDFGSKK